jgi:uncharacterized repeat protein (TIGR01451 family)
MRLHWHCLALALGFLTADIARAQFIPPPGPLMYVRFTGPKGSKITVYRGFDQGQTLEIPCTLGFRPGYAYRLAVFDIPGFERHVFAPTLEVRGTLALTPRLRNADFPATIRFSEEEFRRVMLGVYVRKVIALERPDMAIPTASSVDEPLEVRIPPTRDPVVTAAERGQPMIVFQLGQRFWTPQELNAQGVPGTVLLPGDRALGLPRIPPYLLWNWCPIDDPLHGPRHPSEFVAIYDGGDSGYPAGFDRLGRLKGLDVTDTIAEYLDSKGNRKLAASNRVALCVPRFIVIETELRHSMQTTQYTVNNALHATAPNASVGQVALKEQSRLQSPESIDTRMCLSGTYNTLGTSVAGRVQGLQVKTNLSTVKTVDATKTAAKKEPEDGPLVIIKWPDKTCVGVGELVTFYLKYSNSGDLPITNVVVSDSLAARFEYVKGSTKTDREALFTTQPNEAGSALLRWEFTSPLQPHEHGLITFQVRIR